VLPAFAGRVLPIDTDVARHCARLYVPNPQGERDALIAATALVHGMGVVTRNVGDLASTGVRIINSCEGCISFLLRRTTAAWAALPTAGAVQPGTA
jgi:hypothetical protein